MQYNKLLPSVFLVPILISSLIGWFVGAPASTGGQADGSAEEWNIPSSQRKNLSLFNDQLTRINIWGQQEQLNRGRATKPEWTLVGIIQENDKLYALIELQNELSVKRVALNESILDGVTITSITRGSITINSAGKETVVALYD